MFTTRYSYYINPNTKQFCQTAEGHAPITELPNFYFGDRPTFTLSFPANTITEGDTLVAVLDNENRFLDTKQATGLNPVMTGVLHEVTSEEAGAQSLEIQLFNYSKKFADVINGHDNAVTCLFTVYLKSIDGEGNFTFTEIGQTLANAMPTITSPECIWDDLPVTKYYTREELDAIYNQFLAGVSLVVEYSNLAKSYAVGGTGTREGENTDNAKYYAEMASQAAQAVTTMYGEIQTLATQIANTKEYIDRLVESIAIDIRDISAIAASVTEKAAQVSRDAQSVRQAKSSIDASVQFVSQAKSTVENLATQVSQNAVNVSNDKDAVAQLASQVSNAASQVSRDKADAKGYAESAASTLTQVQSVQTDVTQKQSAVTTMKNTIQGWYNQISSWYNSMQNFMEQMLGWWTDVDTWQQQVSADKAVVVSSKDTAVQAKNDAVAAKTAAETAQEKAETAQEKAEAAQDAAEDARDEAVSTLANKRDILQTLVTSSSTALVAEAGKSYNWTVSADSTIALAAADKVAGKETRIDIYIDLQDGGSVTGDGVTISDVVLQSGWYKLIWDGTNATLYSTKAGGAEAVITIPAATTSYTLLDNKHYQQVPDAVPTYTLPTATMDGLVHEITVLVDFMHVTSCSFVDAGGVPVTLQSAISPSIGEAYIFRCYWYGKWRIAPLKIRNAATASSATGVVEVSDAVAGDALALRMVAPRSVVVNQLVDGDIRNGATAWTKSGVTETIESGYASYTKTTVTGAALSFSNANTRFISGHVYLTRAYVRPAITRQSFLFQYSSLADNYGVYSGNANEWQYVGVKETAKANHTALTMYLDGGNAIENGSKACDIQYIEWVDLTQYFNGDQTLIDSITSWDDLVAYDPRFASYVEYNTGTVSGVQPTVKVSGKNLLDLGGRTLGTLTSGVTPTQRQEAETTKYYIGWAYSNYYVPSHVASYNVTNTSVSGRSANTQGGYGVAFPVNVKAGASYMLSHTTSSNTFYAVSYYDKNWFLIGYNVNITTFTVPNNCKYAVLHFYPNTSNTDWSVTKPQLELGSTATSYEPYHDGGTAQAPAPLFAVGNAADEYEAVSGVTTHKMAIVEAEQLSAANWGSDAVNSSGFVRFNINTTIASIPVKGYGIKNVTSSHFQTVTKSETPQADFDFETIGGNANNSYIYMVLQASRLTGDLTTWTGRQTALKNWMTANNFVILYELATPTTSQSTPAQISLQAGNNVAMQTDGGRTLAELAMTYENLPTD